MSEVSSGGSDTQTADTARMAADTPPARLPLTTPIARPPAVARTSATTARMAVFSAAGSSTRVTGRL